MERPAVLAELRATGLSQREAEGIADFTGDPVQRYAEWIRLEAEKPPEDSVGMVLADAFGSPFIEYGFGWLLRGALQLLMGLLG